jgi:hypothetical protein
MSADSESGTDLTQNLGPTLTMVVQTLEDADGELTLREIVDQTERLSSRGANSALERLHRRGLVEKRQYDPRGWMAYRLAGTDASGEVYTHGPVEQLVLDILEAADGPLRAHEIIKRADSEYSDESFRNAAKNLVSKGEVGARECGVRDWNEYYALENGGVRQ